MNRFSLTFKDPELEQKFQQDQTPIYKQSLKQAFMIGSLIHLASFIILCKYNSYLLMGLTAMASGQYLYLYYRVRQQNGVETILIVFFNVVLIVTPYFIFLYILFDVSTSSTKCLFIIYSQIYIQSAIMSQNLILTSFQFANSLIMLVLGLNQAFGYSEYQYLIILYFFHWLKQEYQKIKTSRTNFISSQINESLYEIMTKTQQYPFHIFTYDEEQHRYNIELTQDDLNLGDFLKDFYVDNKTTLSQYIFQEFIKTKQSGFKRYELSGFIHDKSNRWTIKLFVQSSPRIKFVLQIIERQTIKCPYEILYEQKLTDSYLSCNTNKYNAIAKRRLNLFRTHLYANRLAYLYKFKQLTSQIISINFNKIFEQIAYQYKIYIHFNGSLQYQGDLILLKQVLEGIIMIMINNKKLFCNIKQDINQAVIQIRSLKYIQNSSKIQKSKFIHDLNYLVRQFSFNEIQFKQDSLQFTILTNGRFQYA